jgi:DNA polymerase-3 subunit chi
MTRIDFYVLPEDTEEGPLPTACRLCEKAVGAGKRVHVHASDEQQAQDFDKLLWTYKQGGFVGHERVESAQDHSLQGPPLASVLIGRGEPLPSHQDVMINLAADVPAFFSRFGRVLEIVHGNAAARLKLRERFKFYRDRGYALETHKL